MNHLVAALATRPDAPLFLHTQEVIVRGQVLAAAELLARDLQKAAVRRSTLRLALLAVVLAAPFLERLLGRTGTVVITRLLGMLLAALSVQFVIDGVRGTGLI